MYSRVTFAILFAVVSGTAIAESPPADKELSYSLGALFGKRVAADFKNLDYDELIRGFRAAYQGDMDQTALGDANQVVQQYLQQGRAAQQAVAVQKGAEYLADNAKRDGVSVTDSGLQYEVITVGSGEHPAVTDSVTVHYRGTLLDGSEFDSSYKRGTPATFPLNGVIPGWTEGVQLMQVGSKFRFVIPPELAYGERGTGNSIGPNETLIFEVELISIGES